MCMVSASFTISLFWGAVFNSLKRFESCQDSGTWGCGTVSHGDASRLEVGVLLAYLEAETSSSSKQN